MTNSYTINIDGIGPVLLEKSRRARRVVISVRPSRGIRVAVPIRTSFRKAIEFVCLKRKWIQRHSAEIEENENRKRAFIERFLAVDKAEARKRLKHRLNYLAEKHGFTFNNVSFREQRTRWGSCSHKNSISLNLKLVLLPQELIDYVILHELVHTRIHNHSTKFWTELNRYVGNGKAMAKTLRMNDLRLS